VNALCLSRHQLDAVRAELDFFGDRVSHAIVGQADGETDVLLCLLSRNGSRQVREVTIGPRGRLSTKLVEL
jgi:hypothetical protein